MEAAVGSAEKADATVDATAEATEAKADTDAVTKDDDNEEEEGEEEEEEDDDDDEAKLVADEELRATGSVSVSVSGFPPPPEILQ